ncbi:MAG: hypothetical protein HOP30_17325 [Cyclobacteriaceae bacterium]|nr:hypothetical protein [Cyclobacteriaceae bacterium]
MGLFDLFKKPPTIQDPFFGTLRWMGFKDASKKYFECSGMFAPTKETIGYIIEADASGPTTAQREFYQFIQANYDVLIEKAIPLIEKEYRQDMEEFKISNFKKEFKVSSLTIPRLENTPLDWDMSFESVGDEKHFFLIDFKDFEPIQVHVE